MRLHRWFGLAGVAFFVVLGVTGCVLAFYEELDAWMAPQLLAPARSDLPKLDLATLAERAQALAPDVQVVEATWRHGGRQAEIRTQPWAGNAANTDPEFDSILLDPWTGAELGHRTWGDIRQGTINLIPFVYRLHYELALGHPGMLLLGLVALGWTLDCFIGLLLTLPMPAQRAVTRRQATGFWQRWAPAWKIKRSASGTRRLFDLHRAFSLWCWLVLLVFAWSGVSFNLPSVYEPVMRVLTGYTPSGTITVQAKNPSAASWPQALQQVHEAMAREATDKGFEVHREVMLRFIPDQGIWLYRTHTSRDILDNRGASDLYLDAGTGLVVDLRFPTREQAGRTITHWLYALHVANIGGLPWKIAVAFFGLVLVMLSVTGVLIWRRKHQAKAMANKPGSSQPHDMR